MSNSKQDPKTIYLKDYEPPHYGIDTLDLVFDLYEDHTDVMSTLKCRRNPDVDSSTPLVLQGNELKLKSIQVNGKIVTADQYQLDEENLTLSNLPNIFTLQIITEIHPEKNTALSGLYRSKKLYCTQCEAEGFRRITFFQDRPDVMTQFTTTIHADKRKYPVLLSNGNCIMRGEEENDRHWTTWEDPFKKPCYLFALVAGNLIGIEDHYVTKSGRLVTLKIFVEWENQDKCAHAMDALKKAMKWDEETYGREYDLDIYMIVAVNDFNMGAMENKGLNIFNSKYILARPETATDRDFENIDSVVGHEYFHNWTGNRITCRDWFQLSLKEGLTVFREQQFSADITKSAVSLIENADRLRTYQFTEDAGPMAHSVRPESYVEINNFYTTTIYEKGAEVIRMLRTLLGSETFRKGMDLYFERHDGQAVTTDDFIQVFADVSGKDLSQFLLWYRQAGTPEIQVQENYDDAKHLYTLTLKQFCPPTPNQPNKQPMMMPIALGLLDSSGRDMLPETRVLVLTEETQVFRFTDIPEKPVLSLLRDFSAPVKIKNSMSDESLAFLLAHDSDAFNRWDAGQKLSERLIFKLIKEKQEKKSFSKDHLWFDALHEVLKNKNINPALKVMLLTLPSMVNIVELMAPQADPEAIYAAKKFLLNDMASSWKQEWQRFYEEYQTPGLYHYTTELSDKRAFKNLCLSYLLETEVQTNLGTDLGTNLGKNLGTEKPSQDKIDLVVKQWKSANNMTDAFAAISILSNVNCPEREAVLSEFYQHWLHDPLVIDKWLRVQATSILPNTLSNVKQLLKHSAFEMTNPNKVYSLIGGFSANLLRFHDKSGEGYQFLADRVIELNALNPQVASRMMNALTGWRKFESNRSQKMKAALERISATPKLSSDVYEIVSKSLKS